MLEEIGLTRYIQLYGEDWADNLQGDCPPEDICISCGDVFYRFILDANRITEQDWLNYLVLYPDRVFAGEDRIYASGLSIQDSLQSAQDKWKLPYIKKRFHGLAAISLSPEDGVVKQTLSDIHHFTWWRTNRCNLDKAQLV